jgi:CTP:molybdopterin cytidylyltransferase MocA
MAPGKNSQSDPQYFPLILLAGGQSSRMGTPKGLVDYHGKPWLLEQLGRFETAGGKEAVVVLGYHLERYFEKIPWLRTNGNEGLCPRALTVSVVVNQTPACGQFSSLKSAISFLLEKDCPGAFILPVDVPGPQREVYDRLSAALISKTDVAIPQYRSKGGHPVLLSRRFLGQLISLSLESNEARLDLQIRGLPPERVARVRVNDAQVRLNINLSSDFSDYADRPAGTRSRPGY